MSDARTLRVYAEHIDAYTALDPGEETAGDLDRFVEALPPGAGPVLDWGAGPGREAMGLIARGLACEAADASPEMTALAASRGVPARCEPFEALEPVARYRGIWANFSLLHADAEALPGLVRRAADALLRGGVLHVAFKRGQGTARDELGRRYTYLEAADLDRLTGDAGLRRLSVRHGRAAGLSGHPAEYVVHLSRKRDA